MVETPQLIRAYLRGVRCLSGAVAVSLFAPPRAGAGLRALLVHEGSPPVPELANADAAGEFVARTSVPEAHDDGDRLPAVLPTGSDECCVIPLPGADTPWVARGEPGSAREREPRRSSGNEAEPPSAWLGLRCEPGDAPARRVIAARLSGSDDDPPVLWSWLLALGGIIARHAAQVAAVHTDAVTGLSDRTAFQAVLAEEFEKARAGSHPLSVLLLNPDQFGAINERFGREAGDRIVQDISARLRLALRQSDTVSRYGGVIFSVILADTPADASRRVADKVLRWLSEAAYLDGSVRLAFSIGLATFDAESPAFRHPVDLTRRADQALNAAKRRGGGQVVE